jgi:hypothetical protein
MNVCYLVFWKQYVMVRKNQIIVMRNPVPKKVPIRCSTRNRHTGVVTLPRGT